MAQKVQIPAKKPALAPHTQVVFAPDKNIARLIDINKENKAVNPNIFGLFDNFMFSRDVLLSTIHAFANNTFEYHSPPTKKEDNPATTTASQLMF